MTRAAFEKIAAGLREAIAVAQGDDIPARIECFGAFRPADPVPCERPKTKKGRPARQPVLPVSSLGSGGDLHAPNHAAGTDNASGIAFFPGRIPDDA